MNAAVPRDTDEKLDRILDKIAGMDVRLSVVELLLQQRMEGSKFSHAQWTIIIGSLAVAILLALLLLRGGM